MKKLIKSLSIFVFIMIAAVSAAASEEDENVVIKYALTEDELAEISAMCVQEQGSDIEKIKIMASQMANNFEKNHKDHKSLHQFVLESGWYKKAKEEVVEEYRNNEEIQDAVFDVLCNGNRELPKNIDEYDWISDIKRASNNGIPFDPNDTSMYKKDVTLIENIYGGKYTFYCLVENEYGTDVFGYTE